MRSCRVAFTKFTHRDCNNRYTTPHPRLNHQAHAAIAAKQKIRVLLLEGVNDSAVRMF